MKRSSAWMRRLGAGADSASACAAALIEPRRATWTNASLAVNGGRRRMAEIHEVQAETPPSTISRAGAMPSIAILAIVIVLFALAQNYAALQLEQAFQASSPKKLYGQLGRAQV